MKSTSHHSTRHAGLRFGLYDWASSPLAALHGTFIFPVYFATAVMPEGGSGAWAGMNAVAAITVAIAAPFIGTIADRLALRKITLGICTLIACSAVAGLWWVEPEPDFIRLAIMLSAITIIASECAFVAYNALITRMAGPEAIGTVSGTAWGIGYFGAIVCLGLALAVFVFPATPPFGLDKAAAEHIRITMPLAALWLGVFCIPFFFMVREGGKARSGFLSALIGGWQAVRHTPGLLRFLIARIFFADALVTLFAMGGIFAAVIHGFGQREVLIFAVILNITAGIGAVLGGRADDRFGSIRTIRAALVAMIALGIIAIATRSVMLFWIAGSLIGIFVGPLQAASRSHVARLAPEGCEARVFGFMILTGKATAFLGPALYGLTVTATASDRLAMLVVPLLLMAGLILLPRR